MGIRLLTCLVALSAAPPAAAQCFDYSDYFHDVGGAALGPGARAVAAAGARAYVAAGAAGLHVVAVDDPAHPVLLATIDTPGDARGVAAGGGLVFVADGGGFGVSVVDPALPPATARIGGVATPGLAYGVAAAGDRLFVADGSPGLQIIDVSDPTAPLITGAVDTHRARGVAVRGALVLVADGTAGLKIIDPDAAPGLQIVGQLVVGGDAYGVAWRGDLVCLATFSTGLQVIDVADPAAPVLLGSVDTPGAATGVAISGDWAWVADGAGGLHAVDLADPASPQLAATVAAPPADARAVAAVPGHALVADGAAGLRAVAASRIAQPASGRVVLANGAALAGADGLAFGGTSDGYFHAYDLTDPLQPALLGSTFSVKVGGAAVSGPRAIGFNRDGLVQWTSFVVLDVSDPTAPRPARYLFFLGGARAGAIAGTTAYAGSPSQFAVIDATDVDNAAVVGTLAAADIRGLVVDGDHAHTVSFQSAMRCVDVSDQANPRYVGALDLGPDATGIALLAPGQVVVLNTSGTVRVVDVSDPAAPVAGPPLATRIAAPLDVVAGGTKAYVNNGTAVEIIDLADPAAPRSLAVVGFPAGIIGRAAIAGDRLLLADGSYLLTLPVQCAEVLSPAPAPVSAPPALRAWPNPFNPRLVVESSLPEAGPVRLAVFDLRGRVVRRLVAGWQPAGPLRAAWDGLDASGRAAASGVYVMRLETAAGAVGRRVTLLR